MFNSNKKPQPNRDLDKLNKTVEHFEDRVEDKLDNIEDKVKYTAEHITEIDNKLWQVQKSTRTLIKTLLPFHEWLRSHSKLYYNWHLKSYSHGVHWGTLALSLVLIIFMFGYQLGFFGGSKPASYAAAGIPKMVNYQGKLTNASDIPVADGSYNFKLTIYDSAGPGGNALWSARESDACGSTINPDNKSISVSNGIFSTLLGETGDCPLNLDFNDDSYWLEVVVGGETLAPRKRLGAVGYAYNSDTVDRIHASTTATANYLLPLDANVDFSLPDDSKVTFRDAGLFIHSAVDGKMLISADGVGTDDITLSGTVTGNDTWTATALSVTSSSTTADNKAISISQTGATIGTDYGLYVTNTGVGTTNVGGYFSASGGTTNYGVLIDAGDGIFDDNLVVGGSTSRTETLLNSGFVLGGDDLFVAGMAGIEGSVYTNTSFIAGASTTYGNGSITQSSSEALTIGTTSANLTLQSTTSGVIELASGGTSDIILDAAGDVVLDGTSQKLEFGSADSGEYITGNGTDLTVASGGSINLNTSINEKVTNGTFDTDTGWTKGTNWTISGGKANHGIGLSSELEQNVSVVATETYLLTFTVSDRTTGQLDAKVGGSSYGTAITANGTYTQTFTAINTGNLMLRGDASFNGSVDDVSLKKVGSVYTNGIASSNSIKIQDTNNDNSLQIMWNENDTADRILNILVSGANRSLTVSGTSVINQDVSTSGTPTFAGVIVNGNIVIVNGNIAATGTITGDINRSKNDNAFINGNFDFWQVGTGPTALSATPIYIADMFNAYYSGSVGADFAGSQNRGTHTVGQIDVPGEPQYYYNWNITNAGTIEANGLAIIVYSFEDVRTFAGQTATLSFYAKVGAGTPQIGLELVQNFGTGGLPAAGVTGIDDVQKTLSTTWTKYTRTFNIPAIDPATQTIGANATSRLILVIWIAAGSNHTARSGGSTITPSATTYNFSQFKLEKGSVATLYQPRMYGEELAMCQRYFEKSYNMEDNPSAATGVGSTYNMLGGLLNGVHQHTFYFKVSKRTSPSVVIYDNVGNINKVTTYDAAGAPTHNVAGAIGVATESNATYYSSGNIAGLACQWTADARY